MPVELSTDMMIPVQREVALLSFSVAMVNAPPEIDLWTVHWGGEWTEWTPPSERLTIATSTNSGMLDIAVLTGKASSTIYRGELTVADGDSFTFDFATGTLSKTAAPPPKPSMTWVLVALLVLAAAGNK